MGHLENTLHIYTSQVLICNLVNDTIRRACVFKLLSPRLRNTTLSHLKIALQYLERRFSFSVRMLGSVVFVIQTVSENKPIKLEVFFCPVNMNLSISQIVLGS